MRDFLLIWRDSPRVDSGRDISRCGAISRRTQYSSLPKSRVYFDDVEDDTMPELHLKADWEEIKAYFRHEIPKVAKDLLGL